MASWQISDLNSNNIYQRRKKQTQINNANKQYHTQIWQYWHPSYGETHISHIFSLMEEVDGNCDIKIFPSSFAVTTHLYSTFTCIRDRKKLLFINYYLISKWYLKLTFWTEFHHYTYIIAIFLDSSLVNNSVHCPHPAKWWQLFFFTT